LLVNSRLQSLEPKKRLCKRSEYLLFFNRSKKTILSHCIIYQIQTDLNYARLGITLKAKGIAVNRNQVKRQIRETFRRWNIKLGSFDYNIVVPKSKNLRYPFAQKLAICLNQFFSNETC